MFDLTVAGYGPFGLISFPLVCGCVLRVSGALGLYFFFGVLFVDLGFLYMVVLVFPGHAFKLLTVEIVSSFFFSWLIWNGYYVPWRFLLAFGTGFTPQHNLGGVSFFLSSIW